MTFRPVAERLAMELSLLRSVPTGDRTPVSHMRGERCTTMQQRRSDEFQYDLKKIALKYSSIYCFLIQSFIFQN